MQTCKLRPCLCTCCSNAAPTGQWCLRYTKDMWAVTCDFQQCGILTYVDSDEPVQPPVKLRNCKRCSVSSITYIEYSSGKHRLWSDCAYAHADLSLCWSHILDCWKYHVAAHIVEFQRIHEYMRIRHNSSETLAYIYSIGRVCNISITNLYQRYSYGSYVLHGLRQVFLLTTFYLSHQSISHTDTYRPYDPPSGSHFSCTPDKDIRDFTLGKKILSYPCYVTQDIK